MSPPRECLYVTLGVPQTATDSEIRKAYRTLALSHHPDKNPGRESAASEQFKAVQHAYSVLSDPHERAWYDAHRLQILRGHDPATADPDAPPDSANATEVDLFACFSSSAYTGFADGPTAFYAVYGDVFDRLWQEDVDELDRAGKPIPATAPFGGSDAHWDTVRAFYARWDSFSSAKSFAFADKWHLGEAPNREVRRLMEKDNKKARAAVRKEFNSTVRELAAFVKKRDPRVARRRKEEQAEREKKDELAKERERAKAQMRKDNAAQMRAARDEVLEEDGEALDQILEAIALDERLEAESKKKKKRGRRKREGGGGVSDDGTSRGDGVTEGEGSDGIGERGSGGERWLEEETEEEGTEEGEEEEEEEELYCVACRKAFRTRGQMEDHERSKKHKSAMGKLRREVLKEEKMFAKAKEAGGGGAEADGTVEESAEMMGGSAEGWDDEAGVEVDEAELERARMKKMKKKNKRNKQLARARFGERSDGSRGEDGDGGETRGAEGGEEADADAQGGQEAEAEETVMQPKLTKKQQRRLREQRKREEGVAKGAGGGSGLRCNVCAAEFASRNRLMGHVEKTGHARHVEGVAKRK